MAFAERKDRAIEKVRDISGRSWKDQLGLVARIAEIPFCFGVFVNAAVDMADRGEKHLNPATDGLVTYSLVLSILALVWCGTTMGIGALKKYFHWPGDLFFVTGFSVMAGMYTGRAETACNSANPHIWDWSQLLNHDLCNKTKAYYAFTFMTTMAFILSTLTGLVMAYAAKSWNLKRDDWECDLIANYEDNGESRSQV